MLRGRGINICHEFSLNWEVHNGIIKKVHYDINDKFAGEIQEIESKFKITDEEEVRNFGKLSMNAVHDGQIREIKDLLDTLNISRASHYKPWFDVMCVLSNISTSYKDLAEYFTRKPQDHPELSKFESTWLSLTRGVNRGKKPLTLGSLHWWAKQDNPERYKQIRSRTIHSILNNMVYEGYAEGILGHYDVATLLYHLLRHKFVNDIPQGERTRVWYEFILDDDDHLNGELYKWRRWNGVPSSLNNYISTTLPNLFLDVFKTVKKNYEKSSGDISKYYGKVLQNFKASIRKLKETSFKRNIMNEAEHIFSKLGFSQELDVEPLIRGVQNGVLKLSCAPGGKPLLIQGHHNYLVSKYTTVPYIAFDPYDYKTKKIMITLRNMFPDNEPDSHEFVLSFLSSTLDSNMKESMFMIMVGIGANGKSFIVELHVSAIGTIYGIKMRSEYLTGRASNADSASPALMALMGKSFAYYSETENGAAINTSRIKELTGRERMSGRKNYGIDEINFIPTAHHLMLTNNEPEMRGEDNGNIGMRRRLEYINLKITFKDITTEVYDEKNPYQRIADPEINSVWTSDPEIQGRYLGLMVWYHYWLYHKYGGLVKRIPHPHIRLDTENYMNRQNFISIFLKQRCVKVSDEDAMFPIVGEIQKYIKWYATAHGGTLPAKGITEMFQKTIIGKHIKNTKRGYCLVGHRFLDTDEQEPDEGEEFAVRDVFELTVPEDNFGIKSESSDEYYARMCAEYDKHKHIFDNNPVYNVDATTINESGSGSTSTSGSTSGSGSGSASGSGYSASGSGYSASNSPNIPYMPKRDNNIETSNHVEVDGRILPCGIVLRALEEPNINVLTDSFYGEMCGYLPDIGDIIVDE